MIRPAEVAALACAALLLAGCVAPLPPPPPKRPYVPTARDLALLSSLGEESGIKVTAVDGVALDKVGRRPANAPAGMNHNLGVWLSPGVHLIHVKFARNIASGISFAQGNLRVSVAAGRTYIVRPYVTTDFGEVSFSLIDHGTAFPLRCLPHSINQTRPKDARGRRAPFAAADILACRERAPL